jgi:hypothetical protein
LVERLLWEQEVARSNRVAPIFNNQNGLGCFNGTHRSDAKPACSTASTGMNCPKPLPAAFVIEFLDHRKKTHVVSSFDIGSAIKGWLDAAASNGLKVVALLNPNPIYADQWDPTAAAAFCTWLAKINGAQRSLALHACKPAHRLMQFAKPDLSVYPIRIKTNRIECLWS